MKTKFDLEGFFFPFNFLVKVHRNGPMIEDCGERVLRAGKPTAPE